MKKLKLITVLFSAVLLAGCSTSNNSSKSSSSSEPKTEKKAQSSKKAASSKESQQSSTAASSSSSSASSSSKEAAKSSASSSFKEAKKDSSSEESSNSTNSALTKGNQRMMALRSQLKGKLGSGEKFPTAHLINGVENARYTGDSKNYTVYYYGGNRGVKLNDSRLNKAPAFVSLTKKSYSSQGSATASIEYTSSESTVGLPGVDLGSNITGTMDSGAGQKYLHWNEGRWSMTVRASSVRGQDPTKEARQIVAMTQSYYLPAPETRGSATFEINNGGTLSWVRGDSVYTMRSTNYEVLIAMASSLK